ncbi:hypothetical protein [Polymorphobacter megasporae]|uniref:hypothetical protein n=1 Tax=Glacieibacterium megasporae TaxID=2835787 RepID=UPI001C1E8411|nr:hypothetical protein [Polymorphobacter megasporae]UAJ12446.1 hypothetical protein KTC28_21810 [Polymorphobacter megasporae]
MIEPVTALGTGANSVTKSSSQRPNVNWPTRLRIALDVAVERRSPWASPLRWMTAFAGMVTVASLAAIWAGVASSLVVAAVMIKASLMILLSGPIIDRIMYRMHTRAALPEEIAALRLYSRPGTWPMVRNAADGWRRSRPKLPITIAMILRWEGEAAAEIRATLPPSTAEQAAAKAQVLAFE